MGEEGFREIHQVSPILVSGRRYWGGGEVAISLRKEAQESKTDQELTEKFCFSTRTLKSLS